MIIGISGKATSGKDTAATYLQRRYGGVRIAYADALKREARDLIYRLTGEYTDPWKDKHDRMRHFLQVFGTELMREWKESVWVDLLIDEARLALQNGAPAVYVSDVRFPNEVEAIHWAGGRVIRLEAGDEVRAERMERLYGEVRADKLQHPSETALDGYENFDAHILSIDMAIMEHDLDAFMASIGFTPRVSYEALTG